MARKQCPNPLCPCRTFGNAARFRTIVSATWTVREVLLLHKIVSSGMLPSDRKKITP